MYLKGITDRNVGLAHVTIREILEFLFQNYGIITQYDIEENDKKIKRKMGRQYPIKMLFDQIDNAQDFAAAAGQPYMNNQLLTTAYNLVYTTGLFFDDCKAWNWLPTDQKTMDNFKTVENSSSRFFQISCSMGILNSFRLSCCLLLRLLVYMYLSQLMRTFTNYLKCIVISS